MFFSKFRNRFRLYNNIIKNDDPVFVVCVNCFLSFCFCIMIKNHSKCVECVCQDCFCVDASWKNLDRVRNKLKSNITVIENELVCVLIKLTRLKKMLKYIKFKIAEKSACLIQKLIDDNDDVSNDKNSFFFWQFVARFLTIFYFFCRNFRRSCWQFAKFLINFHVFFEIE